VTIYVVLGTLLVGFIYFALTATGLGLLLSPAVGFAAYIFFRLVDPEERGRRGYLRVLCASIVGGIAGAGLSAVLGVSQTPTWDWAGVAVVVIFASAMYSLGARGATEPCVLCKSAARTGFHCPRCNDWVCARPSCWNAKYSRCTRCHEREIVIFPIAERWWESRLGRRVMKGECTSCYTEAGETDLRECGQCHWPMCRRCWDYHNGVCKRCEWTIPDLPPVLAPFARKTKAVRAPAPPAQRRPAPAPAPARPREAPRPAAVRPQGSDDATRVVQGPAAPKGR